MEALLDLIPTVKSELHSTCPTQHKKEYDANFAFNFDYLLRIVYCFYLCNIIYDNKITRSYFISGIKVTKKGFEIKLRI